MQDADPIPFPAKLDPWMVAHTRITRDEASAVLHEPHFVETETTRTAGGEEHNWGFEFPCGMRVLIELHVPYKYAAIYSDPPDAATALVYLKELVEGHETTVLDPPQLIQRLP